MERSERRAPAEPSAGAGAPPPSATARALKIVGGITAVLSLAFGIRQAIVYGREYVQKRDQVQALVATAKLQSDAGEYRAAWGTLGKAASIGSRGGVVREVRENLAMLWLENASTAEGLSLGAIADTVAPVLTAATVDAAAGRRADLTAHLGWADFLRLRSSPRPLDPAARYRQALADDPQNVFAHAMLGHWILWRTDSVAEAERHFAAALASGRQRELVRRLELSALANRSGTELQLLRVANDMRVQKDSVTPQTRDVFWDAFYSLLRRGGPRDTSVVSPRDLRSTYHWLFDGSPYERSKPVEFGHFAAMLDEAAGDSAQALAGYRAAKASATSEGLTYPVAIDSAIRRLGRRP